MKFSLTGKKIIEASAGTGKTFFIVVTYIRLILGINYKNNNKPLSINEILVLTFNKSAKEEILNRIKKIIQNLKYACFKKNIYDAYVNMILNQVQNLKSAYLLLLKAEEDLNQAKIFTVDSFFYRILNHFSFHINPINNFKQNMNEKNIYLKATINFWRKKCYFFSKELLNIIYKTWKTPLNLFKEIEPWIFYKKNNPTFKIKKIPNLEHLHKKNIKKINFFKKSWLGIKNKIFLLIDNISNNKKFLGKKNKKKWINTINFWAKQKTIDYFIPNELIYFQKKINVKNKKNKKMHNFFIYINFFLEQKISIKKEFILTSIKNILSYVNFEKKNTGKLEYSDFSKLLFKELKKRKNNFLKKISKKFCSILIDEFQDINLQQYKIIKKIFYKQKNIFLLLIGDPKQSIYNFRGASILSYLQSKFEIKSHFFLDTNWRSTPHIVKNINLFFSRVQNPFLTSKIKFIPSVYSIENKKNYFRIKNSIQPSFSIFFNSKETISKKNYEQWISKECAKSIFYWLETGKRKSSILSIKNKKNYVSEKDIVVIVKNKNEAYSIQKALKNINISSIYLSSNKNVFASLEAKEFLWILTAILDPKNERKIKRALCTNILENNSNKINKIFLNFQDWSLIIKKFKYFKQIWEKSGVFSLIKHLIKIKTKKISLNKEMKSFFNINNFLHLAELINEKFFSLNEKQSLVYWLEKKINNVNFLSKNNFFHIPTNNNFIKIISVHKSKGLEFPLVWIPFIMNYTEKKIGLYFTKEKKLNLNLDKNSKKSHLVDNERLSEDIRLLYVSLTRATIHCSLGIARISKTRKKKYDIFSTIHQSAFGYLLQKGKKCNFLNFKKEIKEIKNYKNIKFFSKFEEKISTKISKKNVKSTNVQIFHRNIKNYWNITSYSQLKIENINLNKNEPFSSNKKNTNIISNILNPHYFPKGNKLGSLLHNILRKCEFSKEIKEKFLVKEINKEELNEKWVPILKDWINQIFFREINKEKIVLSKLKKGEYLKELKFFFPIKKMINDQKLNEIIQLNNFKNQSPPFFKFKKKKGIITGFIDLIVFLNKKYYILEYKSNWLGINNSFYCTKNIEKEIIKQRYDIQCLLYTIALNRYLNKKIKKYDFNKNFGGFYFLFIRGMYHEKNASKQNSGIYLYNPKKKYVNELDNFFKGK
ncbi:exodeoxyribonuclease V subunit beta [Buchnera aphidicola (Mindarus keteleerifoliae)]